MIFKHKSNVLTAFKLYGLTAIAMLFKNFLRRNSMKNLCNSIYTTDHYIRLIRTFSAFWDSYKYKNMDKTTQI